MTGHPEVHFRISYESAVMSEEKQSHLKLVYSRDSSVTTRTPESAIGSNGSYVQVRRLLRAVLDAKLTPTVTIEEACHLRVYGADEEIPRMEFQLDDVKALRHAGLGTCIALDNLPAAIVIEDPAVFKARFPQLADAVPVMLAHGGVQPYTDGLPRHPATRAGE